MFLSFPVKYKILIGFLMICTFCEAQFNVREIKYGPDKATPIFIFQVFQGGNKAVAKKINDYLQNEILETTTDETRESEIFEISRHISTDSIHQSGLTDISYKIELNNSIGLSVVFYLESLGPYPVNYKMYFNFNSQNGELIALTNLISEEGVRKIKQQLIQQREKEITKMTREEEKLNEKEYVEDSAFIKRSFSECNKNAGEESFFIYKRKILFYKEDCLPHAWQSYEINLDIEFTRNQLEKYLTEFGKKVLASK